MPSNCACGGNFIKVSSVMHCARGRFAHIRSMEIRDTFTKLLDDVCIDEIEPIFSHSKLNPCHMKQPALKMRQH